MLKPKEKNSMEVLQEFKCKFKRKQIKAYIEFIYEDYSKNTTEICLVDFGKDEPDVSIIFENEDLENQFYINYNAKFQNMGLHKDILTIYDKDRNGDNLQVKITPYE